ncbi:MAG TPA: hypothetical protein VI389_12415 [Geobacteraceae bacterium]
MNDTQHQYVWRWAAGVTLVYLVAAAWGVMHHELWRDEYQAWLIAANSTSLADVIRNCRYETHPALWHMILYLLMKVSPGTAVMQAAHVTAATAGVFLFNLCAPFGRLEKLLYSVGYYAFFEYVIISRNYVLGILGIMVVVSLYCRRERRLLPVAVALFLLANSNLCGFILAGAFALFMAADLLRDRGEGKPLPSSGSLLAAAIIIVVGLGLALVQIIPPADHSFAAQVAHHLEPDRLKTAVAAQFLNYFPVPALNTVSFWNTSLFWQTPLTNDPRLPLFAVLSVAVTFFLACRFRRDLPALLFYLAAAAGVIGVQYVTQSTFVRHGGHVFMAFVVASWLHAVRHREGEQEAGEGLYRGVLIAMLGVQAVVGLYAYTMELRQPFSNLGKTAAYILDRHLENGFIFGDIDFRVSPLSAAIHRPIYFPDQDRLESFIVWKAEKVLDRKLIVDKLVAKTNEQGSVLLVASTRTLFPDDMEDGKDYELVPGITIRRLARFDGPSICGDRYLLYETHRLAP